MDNVIYYILSIIAVLIILTIHEYSHGYAAYKLGDNTAKELGRLTLNPIKHLDPIGALCMLFFHFGWARPVPINPRNFKKPKRDFAIVALAGPLSNLVMGFISAFLYLFVKALLSKLTFGSSFSIALASNLLLFIYIFHSVNVGLGIFNLIPVPPLDGSRLLNVILPTRIYFGIMKYERQIYIALIAWLFLGTYLSSLLLALPFVSASAPLSAIARCLSLSHLLDVVISAVSDGFMAFWRLIPFLNI